MIFYDTEQIEKTNDWNDDYIFVLADFDRTLSSPDCCNSWGIIINNQNISDEYKKEVSDYF